MNLLRTSNSLKVLVILVLILVTLGGAVAYAQIGPDAYRPVIFNRNINGQTQQRTRRPKLLYEGYKDYQFDSATPISDMSDVEETGEVKPILKRGIFSSRRNPDVIQGLISFEGELQRNPSSKGYIVVYAAGPDRRNRLIQLAFASATKDYFTKPKPYGTRFETSRLITVDGGVRDQLTIEFWKDKP